jgi:hypothetical protein
MRVTSRLVRIASFTGIAIAASSLTGCYVVPLDQHPYTSTVVYAPAPQVQAPVTFAARLYPANDAATGYGMVLAVVTNDLNGRGHFSTNINGESFAGEATRTAGSPRDGVANGAGNRGNFINCRFSMNSTTQGTGNCRLNDGAVFTMHLGG